jgi:3-hydroxyacyl-[acyl-carrier-protein] dehydratase
MKFTLQLPKPGQLLPHGEPILQIDSIDEYVPGKSLTALKEVTLDNPFLKGHFPGYPLMPGVILIEMMFQACGLYGRLQGIHENGNKTEKKMGKAIKISNATFKGEIKPPANLKIHVQFVHKIFSFSVFKGQIFMGDKVMVEAELTVYI